MLLNRSLSSFDVSDVCELTMYFLSRANSIKKSITRKNGKLRNIMI